MRPNEEFSPDHILGLHQLSSFGTGEFKTNARAELLRYYAHLSDEMEALRVRYGARQFDFVAAMNHWLKEKTGIMQINAPSNPNT